MVDLASNAAQKRGTSRGARRYVHESVRHPLRSGVLPAAVSIELKMSTMKPLLLKLIDEGMQEVANGENAIRSAWSQAGYNQCWDSGMLHLAASVSCCI